MRPETSDAMVWLLGSLGRGVGVRGRSLSTGLVHAAEVVAKRGDGRGRSTSVESTGEAKAPSFCERQVALILFKCLSVLQLETLYRHEKTTDLCISAALFEWVPPAMEYVLNSTCLRANIGREEATSGLAWTM
jgi:hypothetical protein